MRSRRSSASRPDNRPIGDIASPPPAPEPDTIPADADWWYDSAKATSALINTWNTAPTGAGTSGTMLDLRPAGMPGRLRLKNASNKPRCVHSGTFRGALRGMRRSEPPFADPTGGPPDHDDEETLDAAHNDAQPYPATGDLPIRPQYGQRFSYGFRFRLVAGKADGYPVDGDAEGWTDSRVKWVILGGCSSNTSPTTEILGIYLKWGYLTNELRIYPKTGRYINSGGVWTEYYDFWTPSGRKTNANSSWSPAKLEASDGLPLVFNRWYTVKFRALIKGPTDTGSEADFFVDDMETPVRIARGVGIGKSGNSKLDHIRMGAYGDYKLYGWRRNFLMDKMWVRLGS